MAIIKYISILVLLLGVGYLILGLNSSYNYSNRVALMASPEVAMEYMTNPQNLTQWNERVQSVSKNKDGSYRLQLVGESEGEVKLQTTRIERDSFIWEGEWITEKWTKSIRYDWQKNNVLCSLFVEETIVGHGFFNTANQAWNIGTYDHQRDDSYDSLQVRIKNYYLKR